MEDKLDVKRWGAKRMAQAYKDNNFDYISSVVTGMEGTLKSLYRRDEFDLLKQMVEDNKHFLLFPAREEIADESFKFQVGYAWGMLSAYEEILISSPVLVKRCICEHLECLTPDTVYTDVMWTVLEKLSVDKEYIKTKLEIDDDTVETVINQLWEWDLLYAYTIWSPGTYDLTPKGHWILQYWNRQKHESMMNNRFQSSSAS